MIQANELDAKRKRLIYRSKYRGTKELDLFFGPFAEAHLDGFNSEELDEYERILETSEPVLFDWISGRAQPPSNMHGPVMEKVLSFNPRPTGEGGRTS
jgi:antitoxin CptB